MGLSPAHESPRTLPARRLSRSIVSVPPSPLRASATISSSSVVMEGDMNMLKWNSLIQALVLVRLGQELGTDSRLAKALHDLVEALAFAWR